MFLCCLAIKIPISSCRSILTLSTVPPRLLFRLQPPVHINFYPCHTSYRIVIKEHTELQGNCMYEYIRFELYLYQLFALPACMISRIYLLLLALVKIEYIVKYFSLSIFQTLLYFDSQDLEGL